MPDDKERPRNGFDTRDDAQLRRHHQARALLAEYNASRPEEADRRTALLARLLGKAAPGVWIEPPFYCDYGDHVFIGTGVFVNFNCVFLDGDRITIGDGTLLGPGVQVYATSHPIRAEDRMFTRDGIPAYRTTAAPVTIGSNCWIGGGTVILPGVTIGDRTTVGAASVVTKSLPAGVFAAGNPCKVLRDLDDVSSES